VRKNEVNRHHQNTSWVLRHPSDPSHEQKSHRTSETVFPMAKPSSIAVLKNFVHKTCRIFEVGDVEKDRR
jgi:hypothetical protein